MYFTFCFEAHINPEHKQSDAPGARDITGPCPRVGKQEGLFVMPQHVSET